MMNVNYRAFLLHRRAYKETSLIAEFFTFELGKISLLAKGAKRPKNLTAALLQPFIPLSVMVTGRGDLRLVKEVNLISSILWLNGKALVAAIYLNELLSKLLPPEEANFELFDYYAKTLSLLAQERELLCVLRLFEFNLLKHLGYALPLTEDVFSGKPVVANKLYCFYPDYGPRECGIADGSDKLVIKGDSLLALVAGQFNNKQQLTEAKLILRAAINRLLNGRPIKSRELLA